MVYFCSGVRAPGSHEMLPIDGAIGGKAAHQVRNQVFGEKRARLAGAHPGTSTGSESKGGSGSSSSSS